MALISKPYTFSAGASIIASEHNANFDIIINSHNGNISNANISNSAAISYSKLALTGAILNADINASAAIAKSKLNLTGAIVNADINASAAIADTKLAAISTAGKVSGAALTSLSSIPSGAGVIPVANLPALGLSFVSATTFSVDTSKTISGLTTATPYLLILNLSAATANAELLIYPNGTLSTIKSTSGYSSSDKLALHNTLSSFNPSSPTIGNWIINFCTITSDTTKTSFVLSGSSLQNDGTFTEHSARAIIDSDTALSTITIDGGTMTLTGTAYLYKYAIA